MRRAVRFSAYVLAGLAVLVLAALVIVPQLLDRPRIAAQIQAKLSQAVKGEVRWSGFDVRLLPSPRGVLRGLRVETTAAAFTAEEASVALRLWPLFAGRAEITSLDLERPALRLSVVPAAAVPEEAQLAPEEDVLTAYRSVMGAIVEALQAFAPDTLVTVENATVDVRVEGLPPMEASSFALRARTGERGVQVETSARSRYWTSMKLAGRIEYADLSSAAELHLTRVQGQAWLDWALRSSGVGVAVPDVDLSLRFKADPARALELELDGAARSVTLTRAGKRAAASPVVLKARVVADAKEVVLHMDKLGLGASGLSGGTLRYAQKGHAVSADLGYAVDLAQALGVGRELAPEPLLRIDSATGTAGGRLQLAWAGKAPRFGMTIDKSDAAVQLKDLPGPIRLARAAARVVPRGIAIEGARVAFLDSSALASATLSDFDRGLRVQASVTEARVGGELLDWVWTSARIAPGLLPRTPIGVSVSRLTWGPKQPLELDALARFEAGAAVAVELSWSPGTLDVRRAAIKDARSDVVLSLRSQGRVIEGRYAGRLDSRSLAAMLKSAKAPAGAVAGNLAFTVDRDAPPRSAVDGALKGENLDLSWLAGQPARIERIDLASTADGLQVNEATFEWAGQRATLRGKGTRTDAGPVIDAEIDSPGVVLDALLPKTPAKASAPADPWPLPITGRIAVRSKFVQYGAYKVEPLAAVISLERERAHLEVNEAFVCGLALPLTVEATPKGYAAAAQIAAEKQKLEEAAHCLSAEKVLITGPLDLRADVRTQGQPDELLRNLTGTVSADVRNGTVTRFALLGNILSLQNVAATVGQGGPKLGADSFPFRQLSARGRFDKGRFVLDEGVFHSNAVGLGANGWISLSDFDSRLTVLVAPLALVDEAVRKLPVLGYVVGGTFTSLPVSVTGDIRDPAVVPLGPRAITSELTGILGRTLSLPGKLVPGQP